ncbi:hypothetical protein Achl_4143 (plasmid) [Pseudarthrobacter chlorophenolicus A6]|uniref:Uncharacterized protein n=1 Tax=Pseudarthrobacter chlorophenolicus (strain ATCC 700700 / DSM 12829 / CIP 107037 / JCM 12360 / KCTC 9906 / NCIMB 13794 / A6) TaxID=452863 RepID=B8HI47_PSECP|nr:hypothetical protein [Pseudarthrobacter chlorophenolicus]ACL42094.1 hypothetical protein Achl_4143 [Pseudarthrobacter chlorophenolicus A6]SDQ13344.1 hypothetical protein SAMN04489738_0202 [Pseudarthrobacter chlorophenolicus]
MNRIRRILNSERGDLLIDSMVGAVIIVIMMVAAGSIMVGAVGAATGNDDATTRSILLNTVLSDEKPNLGSYTETPHTLTRTVNGEDIPVTLWREEPAAGMTFLKAAVPKPSAKGADCSGPERLDSTTCMTSSTAITTSEAGVDIKAVPLSAGTEGALTDFTAPAGATELRYVFKMTSATNNSTVTFGNRDHPDAKLVVNIPAGQTGYFYGRLLVTPGSRLFMQLSGAATLDTASTMIYEAPTP